MSVRLAVPSHGAVDSEKIGNTQKRFKILSKIRLKFLKNVAIKKD
jgi:hypothetical protein